MDVFNRHPKIRKWFSMVEWKASSDVFSSSPESQQLGQFDMTEKILNWVNICVKKGDEILLLNRQHDNFKGWIELGGFNSLGIDY